MGYRCEATSLAGFVQQIAVSYIRHGYWWYVTGTIPEKKDPKLVDQKLISKYSINVSNTTRWRRKKLGKANLQYIRYRRSFVLMATKGTHRFWTDEEVPQLSHLSYWNRDRSMSRIRDIRHTPIRVGNYSISYRKGGRTRAGAPDRRYHSHVQIEWSHYKELKSQFVGLATRRSTGQLAKMFWTLPFEPYAPVRRQLGTIWREVNRRRKHQNLEPIPKESLLLRRQPVKPFDRVSCVAGAVRLPDSVITG